MICPTEKDIGRGVIYIGHGGEREQGTITSIRHPDKTFVNYGRGSTSALTRNDQLHWEFPTKDEWQGEIQAHGRNEKGHLMVTLPRTPHVSNPDFLSQELASYEASLKR